MAMFGQYTSIVYFQNSLINAIAALPNKTEPSESSIITSGGLLPPKSTPAFENHVVDTLTDEVRRIFYRYDCECVPLCENQLGVYRACDELADMWGRVCARFSHQSHKCASDACSGP